MCCVCSAAIGQGSSAGRKPLGQVFGQWCQRRVRCVENQQCVSIQQHELHLCPVRTAAGQPQDQVRRPLLKSGSLSNLCVTVHSLGSKSVFSEATHTLLCFGSDNRSYLQEWIPHVLASPECKQETWMLIVQLIWCSGPNYWQSLETSIILVIFITYDSIS